MSKRSPEEVVENEVSKQIKVTADSNLSCEHCKETGFPSRNKLFKHYKYCSSALKLPLSSEIIDPNFNDTKDAYIYVTGGRIRGKTLGYVERYIHILAHEFINSQLNLLKSYLCRYSIKRNVWEKVPNMLENRGSHCSAAIGNIIYVMGGGGFHSNLDSNEKFNCETQTWEVRAFYFLFHKYLSNLFLN
jgi:hypothetical protein